MTIIKTICDSVKHTRFPKEDHLPYWASGQQSYEGWSSRTVWSKYHEFSPAAFISKLKYDLLHSL